MCLILMAWQAHPGAPLIVAANRDEFHARPAAGSAFWADAPELLAGRDLQGGGTWLGVTRSGRFAALTNYREPLLEREQGRGPSPALPTRGALVRGFLESAQPPQAFLDHLAARAAAFTWFNLVVADLGPGRGADAGWASNRGAAAPRSHTLRPGVHGVSNHLLDTPWPKVQRGKAALREALDEAAREGALPSAERLLALLADETRAPDEELPETGVGLEVERFLSPLFIRGADYGTRASTVVIVEASGWVTFVERRFGPSGRPEGTSEERFRIQRDR